ncbi:hypothetical protein BC833DRAFT_612036 [Globomyces pollinis-pini]|nr:hypothetical protein BC833DRAFT_612036 [Globomyces pollinis-pini]
MLLKDERVDPSAHENYPIYIASVFGHTKIVKMLLDDKRLQLNDTMIKLLIEHKFNDEIDEMLQEKLGEKYLGCNNT